MQENPFIRRFSQLLEVFNIREFDHDILIIGDVISESCPNLEHFSERNRFGSYGSQLSQFDLINNHHRYNFLSKLSHLNRVTLTSYTRCSSDLYYALESLAKSQIIELKILVCTRSIFLDKSMTSDITKRSLPDFNTIETVIIASNVYFGGDDGGFELIFHLARYLKNIKTIKFKTPSITNVHKVLELAPSIQTLNLSE